MALAKDVEYLYHFVDSLGVPILRENLDELQQTVHLMQADNTDEFYDISTRNKKYGRVDAINGPVLLEKYVFTKPIIAKHTNLSKGGSLYSKSREDRQIHDTFFEIRKEILDRPITGLG